MTSESVMEMFSRRLVLLRAFSWAFTASTLVALIALAQEGWFGIGDLKPFFLYTGIFSALVAAVGLLIFPLFARYPNWLGYAAGGLVGLVVGILFTVGNRLLLGGWFGAWSIPVFISWLGGGMLGVAAATGTRSASGALRLGTETLSFLCLLLALSFGLPSLARVLTRDQHFTLVYARWYPSDSQLEVEDSRNVLLPQDRDLLRRATILGRVVVRGSHASNTVQRPMARMVVLVSEPITQQVKLAQPYASDVLYAQDGEEFKRYPQNAAVLDRVVEFSPDPSRPGVIRFMVDQASGSRSGADAFDWTREP